MRKTQPDFTVEICGVYFGKHIALDRRASIGVSYNFVHKIFVLMRANQSGRGDSGLAQQK
jgi:hypothetical protein